MGMNLEEYREWLKEHGNNEELRAADVAKKVVTHHLRHLHYYNYTVKVSPRKTIKADGKYYECDLVVKLLWENMTGKHSLTIGVEFKEHDFSKVVSQAIERRPFFDYMYIATRPTVLMLTWEPYFLAQLIKHGIGWVLWDEELVYLLLPAKKRGWQSAEEIASEIEKLASSTPKEPKTIIDWVR